MGDVVVGIGVDQNRNPFGCALRIRRDVKIVEQSAVVEDFGDAICQAAKNQVTLIAVQLAMQGDHFSDDAAGQKLHVCQIQHDLPDVMLILLAEFNNLLGGVFMALMDAYGLSLVSVETWGLLWGLISFAFIGGGVYVARRGLGPNPLRMVLLGNLVNWAVCAVFALRSSIVMLTIGMIVWLALVPVIEAGEQTVLQRAIPYERQGRVFGFAQLIENAASPLTAFLMAPLAEIAFMPFMTDGRGAEWIGSWFGTGPERGIGLMFTLAGLIGVAVTLGARLSRSYRRLSAQPITTPPPAAAAA